MGRKGGLGRGLDDLFADNSTVTANEEKEGTMLRLSDIEPNANQPRKDFDDSALLELADSIKEHGVISPLIVRKIGEESYQIVAGERRWRAARMAGLTEAPAIVKELDDKEAMEIALIENLQREDLNPVEEALGYRRLGEEFRMTQEEVSKRVGKSRPVIANALRLLGLPKEVLEMIGRGELSSGHGRALLRFEGEEKILEMAELAVKKGLTVRDLEKMSKGSKTKEKEKREKTTYCKETEIALTEALGRKVRVVSGAKKNSLVIDFSDDEDLRDLMGALSLDH